MKLKTTKTPLLIAAIATALTVTSFASANAQAVWVSISDGADAAQVTDANFKVKVKKHKFHHGHKFHHSRKFHHGHKFHHGVKKKKYSSPKTKFKKKVLIKKFF